MSKTSEAFEAALQRLLPLVGTGDVEHTEVLTGAILRLVLSADQYAVVSAKQALSDSLAASSDTATRAELGAILESLVCCPSPALLAFGQEPPEEE